MILKAKKKRPSYEQMLALKDIVNSEFGVNINLPTRKRDVVTARKAFAYVLRSEYNVPFAEIGGLIGKDHATIMHYLRNIEHEIATYRTFRMLTKSCADRFSSMLGTAGEDFIEVSRIPSIIQLTRAENATLNQELVKLKKQIEEKEYIIQSMSKEGHRLERVYDMIKQRCPLGAEDKLYDRLHRMFNNNDLSE